MKKTIPIILSLLLITPLLYGQGQVSTRKHKLADFTDCVTQIVLSGNEILSSSLREEVTTHWNASPFEFCDLEQFEKLKTKEEYYFLIILENRFKDEEEPGVSFLSLLKGTPEAAERGIGAMHEVISLPLVATMGGDGRELTYMGALVKTVQEYTMDAMESERTAYGMEKWVNSKYGRWGRMKKILLEEEDLSPAVQPLDLNTYLDSDFHIVPAEEAEEAYMKGSYNTLVSYTVAPLSPGKGSYCYKMLIEAETRSLYFISKHKITDKKKSGFLPEDLKRLSVGR